METMKIEEVIRHWRCESGLTGSRAAPPSPAGSIELPGGFGRYREGVSAIPRPALSEPDGGSLTMDCGPGTVAADCLTVPLDNTFGCCLPQPWGASATRDD